ARWPAQPRWGVYKPWCCGCTLLRVYGAGQPFCGLDDLPGGALEEDADRARTRFRRELCRARFGRVGSVVANLEALALEPIDPLPRLTLGVPLGMEEVDLRGRPPSVDRVGAPVQGLAVALDRECVAGERQAMARDVCRGFRVALGGHDGPG